MKDNKRAPRFVWKKGDIKIKHKKKEEKGELEESVALALQNYRSGLIDVDDLVAFLLPAKLEEGGPGSGWFAPPEGTHVSEEKPRRVQVGITSARPGKTPEQVEKEMGEFEAMLAGTPIKNLSVQLGTGGWEGGNEPTWVTQYDGDGEAIKKLAEAGKKWDQDAVLIMEELTKGGQPQSHFTFLSSLTEAEMRTVEKALVSEGIGGWTWMADEKGVRLIATCVPQWGGDAKAHRVASKALRGILKSAGYKIGLDMKSVEVTVMDRENYDDFID